MSASLVKCQACGFLRDDSLIICANCGGAYEGPEYVGRSEMKESLEVACPMCRSSQLIIPVKGVKHCQDCGESWHYEHVMAIVGWREFTDWAKFEFAVGLFIARHGEPHLIVSGGAKGADTMAHRYATEHMIPMRVIKPDYDTHGDKAPKVRNKEIVELATHILAFPCHEGSGTQHTMKVAQDTNKLLEVLWV